MCLPMITRINFIKIQKFVLNKWIVVAPQEVVAVQQCQTAKYNMLLNGTYLVELNPKCEVHINRSYVLKTHELLKFQFKTIQLPQLNINSETYTKTKYFISPINLDS